MPKKSKRVQFIDLVPVDLVDNLVVETINVTTSLLKNSQVFSSQLFSSESSLVDCQYGSGPLGYIGKSNDSQTVLVVESQASKTEKTYLVRCVGKTACEQLKTVVEKHKTELVDCKISTSQATGAIEIPAGINVSTLIEDACRSQQTMAKSKNKVAVTPNGILEIGSKSSTKYIQIGLAKKKAEPLKVCLSLTSLVKESTVKFFPMLTQHNLDVTDIHALSLRNEFESLNDCDLKNIVLSFIKQTVSLPSKTKLKSGKVLSLPRKVKYVQSALNSSLRYLDDASLKTSTELVITEYLVQLLNTGFPIADTVGLQNPATLSGSTLIIPVAKQKGRQKSGSAEPGTEKNQSPGLKNGGDLGS